MKESEKPMINRIYRKVEETLAISTGLSALISFHPTTLKIAEFGGITPGLLPEPGFDPNFLGTTAVLAGAYIATRGLRVIARESLRKLDTIAPGV